MTQRIYDAKQISVYLGITKGCLHNWIYHGRIPFFRQNKKCFFDIREIDQWIENMKKKTNEITRTFRQRRCPWCGMLATDVGWRYGKICDACKHDFYKYKGSLEMGSTATMLRHLRKRIAKINNKRRGR